MEIIEYKTWSWKELKKTNHTKTKLAEAMGITDSYDSALPIGWLLPFIAKYGLDQHKATYSCFMVYAKNDYFGTVYSAWDECQKCLNLDKVDWIKDVLADKYTTAIKEDLKRLCGVGMNKAAGTLSNDIIKSLTGNESQWIKGE